MIARTPVRQLCLFPAIVRAREYSIHRDVIEYSAFAPTLAVGFNSQLPTWRATRALLVHVPSLLKVLFRFSYSRVECNGAEVVSVQLRPPCTNRIPG